MSKQMWSEGVHWSVIDSPTISNVQGVEQPLFPPVQIPADYMADGRVLNLRAFGRVSTSTSAVNLTLVMPRWGAVGGNYVAYQTVSLPANLANNCWSMQTTIQTRKNGPAGLLFGQGKLIIAYTATTSWSMAFGSANLAGPTVSWPLDLTVAQDFQLAVNWAAAHVNNSITGHIFILESLN